MNVYLFRRLGRGWGIGIRVPLPHIGLFLALGIVLAVVLGINWMAVGLGLAILLYALFR